MAKNILMVPCSPTSFINLAIISPITLSPFAEIVATFSTYY
jgi:hypothetical protein